MKCLAIHYACKHSDGGHVIANEKMIEETDRDAETESMVREALEMFGEDEQTLICWVTYDNVPVCTLIEMSRVNEFHRTIRVTWHNAEPGTDEVYECQYLFNEHGSYEETSVRWEAGLR